MDRNDEAMEFHSLHLDTGLPPEKHHSIRYCNLEKLKVDLEKVLPPVEKGVH